MTEDTVDKICSIPDCDIAPIEWKEMTDAHKNALVAVAALGWKFREASDEELREASDSETKEFRALFLVDPDGNEYLAESWYQWRNTGKHCRALFYGDNNADIPKFSRYDDYLFSLIVGAQKDGLKVSLSIEGDACRVQIGDSPMFECALDGLIDTFCLALLRAKKMFVISADEKEV